MGLCSSWDGTISYSEFFDAARALSEKWKLSNSACPPWTWICCKKPFWVSLHEEQGYLSLENFYCCSISKEGSYHDQSQSFGEEPVDDAALDDPCAPEVHQYDFHIVYSASYRVPVLFFRGYHCDGQPLTVDDIEKGLPANALKTLKESKWTFMTREEHPYLNRPWYTLHACGTSEWMKLMFSDSSSTQHGAVVEQYLVSWLSVVGQVVGLQVPLEMLKSSNLKPPFSSD
ncbi:hypothetical protein Syun_022148 [Stephania yunnanensis]|uniref:Ubiquitin-like-conjugating enzyme ATG10 n=1 Tax=Stephania yunnanensis TaxID=152371 RepID=A0AAP0IIE1_9MAGN